MNRSAVAIAGVAILVVAGAAGITAYWKAQNAAPSAGDKKGQGEEPPIVQVNVTSSVCDPMELTVPAGRVTFSVRNQGSRALEWEILNGVIVVDERENIAPGFTQKLTTKLEPGEYDITCGLLANPKGKLHVVAAEGGAAKPSQIDLIGPLAEYRVYLAYEIDALADDAKGLAEAIKSGDPSGARALLASARAHDARLAPLSPLMPREGAAGDAAAAPSAGKGPGDVLAGLGAIERGLAANASPQELALLADKLSADVADLQSRFESLAMSPGPTFASAADEIGRPVAHVEADRNVGAGLPILQGNIESAKKMIELFHPLIERADGALSQALARDFAAVDEVLAKYRNASGALEPAARLGADDSAALGDATKKLAEDLARVKAAFDLG